MTKIINSIKSPSLKERLTLRFMILLGLVYMFLFIWYLLETSSVEFAPLYWMLIFVLVFNCVKIVYEWVHYFYITVPETPPKGKTYTVDIFTTFCAGEPYEMIVETLHAIKAIEYPHNTYLCDEANDPYLKKICNELGIYHITRSNKINAKAGNINNALKQSSGEICVILDPDHVPFPNFLDPIISHFDNPEIGFVQIVQAYKNYAGGLIAKGAAQQTFQFYGPIMMTMNKYGTVLAIGANCTFRRTALESIGGHAAGLAEDMHTAMQLHAKGWKSVYVPSVLARGLVPDTLSAYYSQQLKWSRGVFELLVTSYPKLFRNFTWQQKLHYGVIPMHYFSGVIFLINFLIPIISLVFNISPINIDLAKFAIIGFPLMMSVILVRHFVQTWVMEDDERGFHVVGGLLMIGTWWIFILGLIYTILRKKVPYIPTPKDSFEENNWPLNIPNIVIIIISIAAIIYGLTNDLSPYTLIMAGFAAINCLILTFSIVASRQQHFRRLKQRNKLVLTLFSPVSKYKHMFWKSRHLIYRNIKNMVLPLTLIISGIFFVFFSKSGDETRIPVMEAPFTKDILLSGIFAPKQSNGLTSIKLVQDYQQQSNIRFNIISLYLAWGDTRQCYPPFKLIDSIYKNGSIPMITWEPWQILFDKTKEYPNEDKEKKVFSRIVKGDYDAYLSRFSNQVKTLNRPVYLRFAHEGDNPFYPWSAKGDNTPAEFKEAWKYVHTYFKRNQVNNVIWVWNPWKATAINAYFPGSKYVDWIGVTNLNYGSENPDKMQYSMEKLYDPFHSNRIFRSGIPVMLAEMGSLKSEPLQDKWFEEAFRSIKSNFPEIKAFVLFNTGLDKNILETNSTKPYDWRFTNLPILPSILNNWDNQNIPIPTRKNLLIFNNSLSVKPKTRTIALTTITKGVNYTKGKNWYKSFHDFTKRELVSDFEEMKRLGITTIKWYGLNIYDHNIFSAAEKQNIKIHYSYWIPDDVSFVSDMDKLDNLSKKIISSVNDLKDNNKIVAWNIGNTVFQKLSLYYYKPDVFYRQDAYLNWLGKLVISIKKVDPTRPVTIDVSANNDLLEVTGLLNRCIPELDSYGLVVTHQSNGINLINRLKVDYFYSNITVPDYLKLSKPNAAFISNWQDEETKDYVSFEGLKDKWGRNKFELYQLGNYWNGLSIPKPLPEIKILLPAITTFPGTELTYHTIKYKDEKWEVVKADAELHYQWALVKTDKFGNSLSMKVLGTGPVITVKIPENPSSYKLVLYVSKGDTNVNIIESQLNTPLY